MVEVTPRKENKNIRHHLDKDLQSILKPLNFMQYLFFHSMYKISNDVISTNSFGYNILSVLGTAIVAALLAFTSSNILVPSTKATYDLTIRRIDIVWYPIGCISNCLINMKLRRSNILLVHKIQNVRRKLKIRDKKDVKSNWIIVICLNTFYLFYTAYFHYMFPKITVLFHICVYLLICFDWNIIYATRILKVICDSVWENGEWEPI